MQLKYTLLAGAVIGAPAGAADLTLSIEIPTLKVAEYHRPYVAVWIESTDQKFVDNLAVWYDLKLRDNEGTKWLKDLRQWWRKSGRELNMPVDGLSSATRAPGEQRIGFGDKQGALARLAPGSYQVVIEAVREVGGRELLRLPLTWPATAAQTAQAQGEHELGKVALTVKP
ncbi:MAG: DUF2271 domain-containing protein [Steroidobacteraceae bacterium]|nr:DUF2271 domain-containing protein [Nevskiaceae bacterium]MCP5359739.1 DUF2271 domain-containing protein [Nevskiaceae bacterium]